MCLILEAAGQVIKKSISTETFLLDSNSFQILNQKAAKSDEFEVKTKFKNCKNKFKSNYLI